MAYNMVYSKIKDSEGREYSFELFVTTLLSNNLLRGKLLPREIVSEYAVYQIPQNAQAQIFKYEDLLEKSE